MRNMKYSYFVAMLIINFLFFIRMKFMTVTENFMFLDPPYDGTFARYGGTDSGGWFNEENHRDLAQDFKNLSCKALMIIGKTPLTEELYRGYIRDEYGVHYAIDVNKTIAKSKSGQNTHLIITNYTNY